MRISLDRSRLLGFEARTDLDLPATAAMVGSKTQGVSVSTARHSEIAPDAPAPATLTFPAA
jgi:hypothetical protein